MSRGERLQQEARKKARARRVMVDVWHWDAKDATPRVVGRKAHTPQPCQCSMCCNPRHSKLNKGRGLLTMQERRQLGE